MTARSRGAGRPLMAVMVLLVGWVAIRASTWEPPFALPSAEAVFVQADTPDAWPAARGWPASRALVQGALAWEPQREELAWPGASSQGFRLAGREVAGGGGVLPVPFLAAGYRAGRAQLGQARSAASHQMLFAAAYTSLPQTGHVGRAGLARSAGGAPGLGQRTLPPGWLAARPGTGPTIPLAVSAAQDEGEQPRPARWSADAWLLLRKGGNTQRLAGVNPASYGSDQAGAVVRYALAPKSRFDPQVYARASKALVDGGEAEVAGGASVSLARSFPLRVHGELRVTDRPGATGNETEVRPAAFVVTGLPRQKVALGLEAESYVQAGYVGGDFETGFVDGKATLEAPVIQGKKARVAIGGGVWGGAQRDASRLDVGPTASAILSTGRASVRASIDYRIRVAGDALPRDGVALTLAASF